MDPLLSLLMHGLILKVSLKIDQETIRNQEWKLPHPTSPQHLQFDLDRLMYEHVQ